MKNKYINNAELNKFYYSSKNVIMREIKGVNKKILDVGCNEGYFGKNNFEKSNQYYGLDLLADAVDVAKNNYKEAYVYDLENLKPLEFEVDKFDYIVFGDVLEHIKNPTEVLKFFAEKYLEKDGKVIISLPNVANWQIRLKLLFGNFDYTDRGILDNTHLKLYTFKSATSLVNFSNLKTKKILYGANIFGYLISFLPFLRNILSTNIVLVCSNYIK